MATDVEIEEAWVNGWTQAYHDLWDIFAIANGDEALAAAEQRATDAEATLATIGGADKATLARKLRRANAATRDAEQRATESEARAERLEARNKAIIEGVQQGVHAISEAYDKVETRFSPHRMTIEECEAVIALRRRAAALAAPATQPDERAAAEREVVNAAVRFRRAAQHVVITDQQVGDAWDDLCAVLDATDGAAKEGGRNIGDDGRVDSSSH